MLMSVCRWVACGVMVCALCACGSQYNRSALDPSGWYAVDTIFVSSQEETGGPQRGIEFRQKLPTLDPQWYSPPCITEDGEAAYAQPYYHTALWGTTDGEKKAARNNLQNAMFGVSDRVFDDHMSSVFAGQDTANLLFGFTAIGFTATGAAGASAELMGALATAVLGAKATLNEEVYAKQIAETISRAIKEDRERQKQLIRVWHDRSMTAYPLEAAIADAKAYHSSGSFFHGLELILESAQDAARDDKKAAEKLAALAGEEDDAKRNELLREFFQDPQERGLSSEQRLLYLMFSSAETDEEKTELLKRLLKATGESEESSGDEDEDVGEGEQPGEESVEIDPYTNKRID